MLTSSDKAIVQPVLNSFGAYVYLVDVLDDGTFRYFAVNWPEDTDIGLRNQGTIVGKRPEEVLEDKRAAKANLYYRRCIELRSPIEFEGSFHADSGQRWTKHFLAPIFDLNGRIVRIMGTVVEITQRKLAEQALQESKERYQSLYDNNPAKFFTVDLNGNILSANKFGTQYYGYSREDLVNTSIFDYIHKDDMQIVMKFQKDIETEPDKLHYAEFRSLKKNGDMVWTCNTARVIEDEKGEQVVLIVSNDISRLHKLSEELSHRATHDSLTGLVNRREFERCLQQMIESARSGTIVHALCYLDIDQFQIINDTCGHKAGDELLHQLASLLQTNTRKQDTLARLGGDEFAVLMKDVTLDQAKKISIVFARLIEEYQFLWNGRRFNVVVSIGVVPITAASGNIEDLFNAMDRACYSAKSKGRNRIHVYHEDDEEIKNRHSEMEWVNRINDAITENRIHLFYQPIVPVNLNDAGGEYYELLLRLEDEEGRIVMPEEFLPAAEHYNLSTRLDQWVIENAFAWLSGKPHLIEKLSLCAINLSGSTLGDDTFIDFVTDLLSSARIPAHKICFEITETAAIINHTSAIRFINALKKLGCRFALDDFGSGWSSLAYLKEFPVDYLKIDGMFVKDIEQNNVNLALVKSINEIGHLMGKKTIAESVESDFVRDRLHEIGVDYCQGNNLGRPNSITKKK